MILLIIGNKGSGKTKRLINMVNETVESSKGNVVCVEKQSNLTHDISNKARLISTDSYGINGFESFYGFLAGICASNYDVTHVFVDATFRIGGRDFNKLTEFFVKLKKVSDEFNMQFAFTLSCDESEVPKEVVQLVETV